MEAIDVRVARLEEQIGHLRADVSDIRTDQKSQNGKLDQLLAMDQQRKGAARATKTLLGIASSGGFLAALGWAWEHFHK